MYWTHASQGKPILLNIKYVALSKGVDRSWDEQKTTSVQ